MNGILLRLAAPLMSFGEHAAFHYRDILPFPTRSALIGLFAAADGRSREEALAPDTDTHNSPYADLEFTVRIDRPGIRHTDYHTVGGGRPHKQGLRPSAGDYRAQNKSTLISKRVYLADAVFTLAVQGPDPLLEHLIQRLEQPAFSTYLGRRACIPDEPLVLGGRTLTPSVNSAIVFRSAWPPRRAASKPQCRWTSSGNDSPITCPPPPPTAKSPTCPSTSPPTGASTTPATSGAPPNPCAPTFTPHRPRSPRSPPTSDQDAPCDQHP